MTSSSPIVSLAPPFASARPHDPFASADSGGVAVTLVDLKRLWIRHQALGPFRMDYDGRRPMVVFLFTPARSRATGERFPRGAFSLLTPGAPVTLESAEPVETLAVAFNCPAAAGLPHQERGQKTIDAGVRALAHEIRRVLLNEGEAAMAYLEQLADSLIVRALMVRGAAQPALPTASQPRPSLTAFNLRRVREHIDSRLAERITVNELAAVAGLSRGYFTRAFHAETGESPHNFILARRLDAVRLRLDAGADDLALVAAQTGFSSHGHMTTAFGQAFGVSPRAYREGRRTVEALEA
ncbi:AraC family transcriptional regulator [Phenylobacterium sp.]|uniref:AraC family transcriptional regulator n=1 Tax=Phenylobacterium sp. TaxID=1871053 RepID=UPI002F3F152B